MTNKTLYFFILAVVVLLATGRPKPVFAQSLGSVLLENTGLQVGMYRGQTQYDEFNYSFRLYSHQVFNATRFGELSISSGTLSGLGYRSQLTPVDYRFGFHLSKLGVPQPNLLGRKGSFYSYVGLGVLYHNPIEIKAPDDPLTGEMGKSLPSSSFWKFDGGIAPYVPAGVGLEIPLEADIWLKVSAGYNRSISSLKFNSHPVPDGYWTFTVGLRFKRTAAPVPVPPPPVKRFRPVAEKKEVLKPAVVKSDDLMLRGVNRKMINFDVLSSHITPKDLDWLADLSWGLNAQPGNSLHINGHADATGTDPINDMISESRARAVWLALVDQGLSPQRMKVQWFSADRPEETNDTKTGRFKNRRAELNINSRGDGISAGTIDAEPLNIKIGKPLFYPAEMTFSWLELSEENQKRLERVAATLREDSELTIYMASVSDRNYPRPIYKELDKARSDKLRAILITLGVDENRVLSYNPYISELPFFIQDQLVDGLPQQTLIIPLKKRYRIQIGVFRHEMNAKKFQSGMSKILKDEIVIERNEASKLYEVFLPQSGTKESIQRNLERIRQVEGLEDAYPIYDGDIR